MAIATDESGLPLAPYRSRRTKAPYRSRVALEVSRRIERFGPVARVAEEGASPICLCIVSPQRDKLFSLGEALYTAAHRYRSASAGQPTPLLLAHPHIHLTEVLLSAETADAVAAYLDARSPPPLPPHTLTPDGPCSCRRNSETADAATPPARPSCSSTFFSRHPVLPPPPHSHIFTPDGGVLVGGSC